MTSLQNRLLLLTVFCLTSVIVMSGLTYTTFQEYVRLESQQNEGQSLLNDIYARSYAKSKNETVERADLLSRAERAEPNFRQEAFRNAIQKPTAANLQFVARSEQEYQNYLRPLLAYTRHRTKVLSVATVTMAIVFMAVLYWHNIRFVFNPIHSLKRKMYDFLNNKYSYEFSTPLNHEVGQLHGTFNLMAQKVIDQIAALKDLDKAKTEFLSIASHELRTPLTSIKGSLSLLNSSALGTLPEAALPLTKIALDETDRLIRIINELLDLAKIEARQFPLKFEWIAAQSLVNRTFDSLGGFCRQVQVKLTFEGDHGLQLHVDFDRLQQVLTNLLSNAIKFSPAQSVVRVTYTRKEDGTALIEVKDSGPGIAPQDQELIFEKFRQATGPNNPLVKGTGLGLAIAKALVEQHGGLIGVHSRPGDGATFYFTLPAERVSLKDQSEVAA